MSETAHPNRFVRLRCPLCDHTSPTCDQSSDVRRELPHRWWEAHKRMDHPYPPPIIERAESAGRKSFGGERDVSE